MNLDQLICRRFPKVTQTYGRKELMLYALGVGAGADPLDERDLRFVYEQDLRPIPTVASVLVYPGFWLQDPALEIDWLKLLHGEQSVEMHRSLRPEATVHGEFRVVGVEDKGVSKGATVFFEKRIIDAEDGEAICTVRSTYFLRADGGCGDFGQRHDPPSVLPDRAPDRLIDLPTLARQALIYRLSGDFNPIHADPAAAAKAGFQRPILHGLCTMGVACRGLIDTFCDSDPALLKSMFVRFSQPVFPGETIRLECFEEPDEIRFRARVLERDLVVLDRGRLVVGAP
jgi:acyl dehydratase